MRPVMRYQVMSAFLLLIIVVASGGFAVQILSEGEYTYFESVYFALITVSTVGYGELPHMETHQPSRVATMVMVIAGVVSVAFFQSTLTALLVEGAIGKALRRRRMHNKLASLEGHVIVAGLGRTGRFVVQELMATRHACVVIDMNAERLERATAEYGGRLLYVVGDATDDAVLDAAGITGAKGLVTALADDRDNLFITLSARSLNPRLRIVAQAVTLETEAKLVRAGANTTVSPHRIGGLRLVTELIRPYTAEFLDQMMRDTGEEQLRFEDVLVLPGSPFAGQTLRDAPIREEANVLVVAVRQADGVFIYNPAAKQSLDSGCALVVLGTHAGVQRLREMFEVER